MTGHGPRTVIVGSAMRAMWGAHPGLERRLAELAGLIDEMACQAEAAYPGAGLDIAALPEMAVSGEPQGSGTGGAFPLEGAVLDVMGDAARRYRCHVDWSPNWRLPLGIDLKMR